MSKRGDNIHKRKDGRWEGRYPKSRNLNGTIQYGSVYGKTYEEARKKLSKISQDDIPVNSCKCREITFGEVLVLWMESNSIYQFERFTKHGDHK